MSDKTYRYFAFISYSHRDMEFAHELQHYLEQFRLPVTLCEKHPETRTNVIPIFRDENNLGAGVLNNRLKSALNQSRYLIVLCSPHSAQPNKDGKHYINDEVYYFLGDRPEENAHHIIPVILRDSERMTAHTCMPPAVRFLNLLGIDALTKGRARCFNDVVATMLHLDPQELWQHKETQPAPMPLPDSSSAAWLNNPFKVLAYVVRNAFNYKGRARRKEYWMGTLGLIIANINLFFLGVILLGAFTEFEHITVFGDMDLFSLIVIVSLMATGIIHLSMTCRRLHDLGVSGWFQLIHTVVPPLTGMLCYTFAEASGLDGLFFGIFLLVTQIALLLFLVMSFTNGNRGANKYGPDPKAM